MTIDRSDPLQLLKSIMKYWPPHYQRGDSVPEIEPYLAANFDRCDFANSPTGTFSIFSEVLIYKEKAKVLVYDSKDREYPNLAVLRKNSSAEWELCSFQFQCTSCFGYGINPNGSPCISCNLTGWGIQC